MSTYRTGNHWGITIVREGDLVTQGRLGPNEPMRPRKTHGDQLVAVVVNGDQALAERICALLNGDRPASTYVEPSVEDWDWRAVEGRP